MGTILTWLLEYGKYLVPVSALRDRRPGWLYQRVILWYLGVLGETKTLGEREMKELRARRIERVFKNAGKLSWWQEQFIRCGLNVNSSNPLEELKKLPVQRKERLLSASLEDFCAKAAESALLWRVTTGTDGSPIAWAQNIRDHFIEYAAYYLRSLEFFSFPAREHLSERFFVMFNYPGVPDYYLSFFAKGAYIPYPVKGHLPPREARDKAYKILLNTKPLALYGAPSALWYLAECVEKDGVTIRPDLVVFSGEMMAGEIKKYLQKVFGCRIKSFYGTRELGTIGFSCSDGENVFHLNSEHIFLEILDEDGNSSGGGEYGQLVMTSLTNAAMPLLRYFSGDMGRWIKEKCGCDTALPRFELMGRESEFLILPCGKIPVWALFESMFGEERLLKIRQYQILQVSETELEIYLIKKPSWSDEDAERMIRAIKEKLGEDIRVILKFVDAIPMHGRKHRTFIPLG